MVIHSINKASNTVSNLINRKNIFALKQYKLKRIIFYFVFLAVTLTISKLTIFAADAKIGSTVDYTLHTDIVTYINGYPIQSYNINGYTAVSVEDLKDYGFTVNYDNDTRSLYFEVNGQETNSTFVPVVVSKNLIGKRNTPVLYTDIKTFFGAYREIKSFNIDGKTIVYVDDLASICSSEYKYDDKNRTLTLTTIKTWRAIIENKKYNQQTQLNDTCFFLFEKQKDETFQIAEGGGSYSAINTIVLDNRSLAFSLSRMSNFGDCNFTGGIININYSGRIAEDTLERRIELSKYFRVFINGTLVLGELGFTQGNGHVDYTFAFEKYQRFEDIKTVRLELGNA